MHTDVGALNIDGGVAFEPGQALIEVADFVVTASFCNLPSAWEQTGVYPVECPTSTLTTTTTTATTTTREKMSNNNNNNNNNNDDNDGGNANGDGGEANPANPGNNGNNGNNGNDGKIGQNGFANGNDNGGLAEPDDGNSNMAGGLSLNAYIGIGAGGAAFLLFLAMLVCCKRRGKRGRGGAAERGIAMSRLNGKGKRNNSTDYGTDSMYQDPTTYGQNTSWST